MFWNAVLDRLIVTSSRTLRHRIHEWRVIGLAALTLVLTACSSDPMFEQYRTQQVVDDPFGAKIEKLERLDGVVERVFGCDESTRGARRPGEPEPTDTCRGVIYVWSPVMPLSQLGIDNIAAAAREVGAALTLIDGEAFREWLNDSNAGLDSRAGDGAQEDPARVTEELEVAMEITRAGATVHYPAILCYDKRGLRGSAILGFKTKEAYRKLLLERLGGVSESDGRATERAGGLAQNSTVLGGSVQDREIDGRPGAYFRYIPGTAAVGFESERRNYILDWEAGIRYAAPGSVDLVPTPDGRYLVTPRRWRGGLEFYSVEDVLPKWYEVFARWVSIAGIATSDFTPIYVDFEMQDQYPSVGILNRGDGSSIYRVLTSWYDGVIYRDYEVKHARTRVSATVRPLRDPVQVCPRHQLSTPIMAKDGTEVAARDESTGTTKIFRINDDGASCEEVLDIGMQTGKLAWDSTGRRIAFAIPRGVIRDGSGILGVSREDQHGIFVLDRVEMTLTRIPASDELDRLTFPEFVEDKTIVFIIRGDRAAGQPDRFRFVCCLY